MPLPPKHPFYSKLCKSLCTHRHWPLPESSSMCHHQAAASSSWTSVSWCCRQSWRQSSLLHRRDEAAHSPHSGTPQRNQAWPHHLQADAQECPGGQHLSLCCWWWSKCFAHSAPLSSPKSCEAAQSVTQCNSTSGFATKGQIKLHKEYNTNTNELYYWQ